MCDPTWSSTSPSSLHIISIVNPKCHSRSSSMAPVWLKVFVYLYIFIHIWMYIDHLWSQSWVSPLCSGTLLQLPYTCICFFSLFGCLCEKNGAKKNPPRIPVTFCDFPFSSETPYALTVVTGPTSRYGLLFFHSVPRKKYKNSESVTCAWASTVPFHAVSQYIRNC